MNYEELIGKNAVDKETEKLGKISRIDYLPGKTIKKDVPYAMIVVKKFMQKTIVVAIEAEKVTKVEGNNVWFSITKPEFTEEAERVRKIRTEREMYTGTHDPSDRRVFVQGIDQATLTQKRKERKR